MQPAKIILWVALCGLAAWAQETPTRTFFMGFTPFPPTYGDAGLDAAYRFLAEHGDLVSHSLLRGVPWNEALVSSDVATYPAALRDEWNRTRLRDNTYVAGRARYIAISPIGYGFLGLAGPWGSPDGSPPLAPFDQYSFDDPRVKQAFLNYAIAVTQFFQPKYLALGIEANVLLAQRPQQWPAYLELNKHVYRSLKAIYPDLTVFTGVQYEHMLGLHGFPRQDAQVRALLDSSDILALSTYPYLVYYNDVGLSYYQAAYDLAAGLGKRIGIEQTGYSSQPIPAAGVTLPGSETLQNSFLGFLLTQAADRRFLFVVNFVPIDYGANYGVADPAMLWAYTGLRDTSGRNKPALLLWDNFLLRPYSVRPVINSRGIVEGAGFTTAVSSGAICTLFGRDLASGEFMATSVPLPAALAGTQVLVKLPGQTAGSLAPVFYVSPLQINFQMPREAAGKLVDVTVAFGTVQSLATSLSVSTESPGIFQQGATGRGAVLHEDLSLNTPGNAAPVGSVVLVYATGFGDTSPAVATGQPGAAAEPVNRCVNAAVVRFGGSVSAGALSGGTQASALFCGLAPGFVGLYQINVRIPAGTPTGAAIPLQVEVAGKKSNIVSLSVR